MARMIMNHDIMVWSKKTLTVRYIPLQTSFSAQIALLRLVYLTSNLQKCYQSWRRKTDIRLGDIEVFVFRPESEEYGLET